MKKFIFDFVTSSFSLFDNPFYNYVTMFMVGSIAFIIAWNTVGKIGARGEIGSILHWIIRFFAFVIIWFLFTILMKLILLVMHNWKLILICFLVLLVVFIIIKFIKKNRLTKDKKSELLTKDNEK